MDHGRTPPKTSLAESELAESTVVTANPMLPLPSQFDSGARDESDSLCTAPATPRSLSPRSNADYVLPGSRPHGPGSEEALCEPQGNAGRPHIYLSSQPSYADMQTDIDCEPSEAGELPHRKVTKGALKSRLVAVFKGFNKMPRVLRRILMHFRHSV